jgi:ferric-dicitrate binding protein FerR (iron transport regulator)
MENPIDQYRIAELIFLELKGELKKEERRLLFDWVNQSPDNQAFYKKIINEKNIINKINAYRRVNRKGAWNKINSRIEEKGKIRKLDSYRIVKYAAAVIIPLVIGSYLLLKHDIIFKNKETLNGPVIISGTQKAILSTSTNERIELGENGKRRIFNFTKATVIDTSHTLTYQNREAEQIEKTSEIALNTLETPRGGEYTLILSDETKVFLNAETKLTFPETFDENSREVTLEGEAYFEVSKSASRPFIVKTDKFNIRVYGTSFNVSAYKSDNIAHTTLVEGSVEVSVNNENAVRLVPGEQACYNKSNDELYTHEVETYIYTDWKDGKFVFANESLENIMIRLSRWYDTETKFINDDMKNYHFSGTLNRYDEINKILDMIALTTNISFEIKANTIIIAHK